MINSKEMAICPEEEAKLLGLQGSLRSGLCQTSPGNPRLVLVPLLCAYLAYATYKHV